VPAAPGALYGSPNAHSVAFLPFPATPERRDTARSRKRAQPAATGATDPAGGTRIACNLIEIATVRRLPSRAYRIMKRPLRSYTMGTRCLKRLLARYTFPFKVICHPANPSPPSGNEAQRRKQDVDARSIVAPQIADNPELRDCSSGSGCGHCRGGRFQSPVGVHAFYSTEPGGLGIGLSTCRSIIEDHGGRLWTANDDHAPGATVRFALPAHRGSPEPGQPSQIRA
jgi:hypothetical protein